MHTHTINFAMGRLAEELVHAAQRSEQAASTLAEMEDLRARCVYCVCACMRACVCVCLLRPGGEKRRQQVTRKQERAWPSNARLVTVAQLRPNSHPRPLLCWLCGRGREEGEEILCEQ